MLVCPATVVTALSPRSELPKCGTGLNTIAAHRGLIGIRMSYASNMEIFGEGEPAEYLYEVVRGLVRSCKILSDGRRQIIAFHMPGDAFGLEQDEYHCFSAEAVNNATILAVKRSIVMGLAARDADFAHQLWAVTAQECQRAQNHIVILGCLNARQRVAAFLLLMTRSSGDNEIELSMTRRDIADYLGLTIETVSRTISQFENDALIGVASTRRIILRDRAALTSIAAYGNSTESYRRATCGHNQTCSLSAETVD
jgi:CRP/FNR family transcriptional regulator, nitrogen fixation regulation protein